MSDGNNRTPLKNGSDWIVLKPEITYGEDLDILDASQVDGRFSLRAHAIARICVWVADWSFPEPITPESVAARSPALGRELAALVASHVDRLEAGETEEHEEGAALGEAEATA
jgi:hypothetical protein